MVFKDNDTIHYQWREGFPHRGVDAQAAGETLAHLQATYGDLTPQRIRQAARPATAVLHPLIEWDRQKAATAYQLQQALGLRSAVQRVVVYYVGQEPQETTIQAFVAHPTDLRADTRTGAHCYRPVHEVFQDPEARKALVRRALHELQAWRQRYQTLHELADLLMVVEQEAAQIAQMLEEGPVALSTAGK